MKEKQIKINNKKVVSYLNEGNFNEKIMKVNIMSHFPEKETFVKISDDLRNDLFSRFQNITLTELAGKLEVDVKNLSRYKLGHRSIQLNLLYKLFELSKFNINKLQDNISIKVGKNGTYVEIGPNISINEDWVYISQFLNSDGHLSKNLWNLCFVNKEIVLINFIKDFFKKLGIESHSVDLRNYKECYFLTIRSRLLLHLFNSVFKVPIGKKGIITIPDFIKDDKSLGGSALRAIFDSEGTITRGNKKCKSPRRIVICSKDKNFLEDSQYILDKFGIKSRIFLDQKRIYRLIITHQNNLKRFLESIKPLHPTRAKKLKGVLETFDEDRIPEGNLRTKILNLLKDKGNLTRAKLSSFLNIKITKFSWHLRWLQKQKLIKVIKKIVTKNGNYYIYGITSKGEKYLANEYGSF